MTQVKRSLRRPAISWNVNWSALVIRMEPPQRLLAALKKMGIKTP